MDQEIVGLVGILTIATRGADGLGEIQFRVRGATEHYLARSEEPLVRGTTVQIVGELGARVVAVVPIPGVADPVPHSSL
jgi:hypothetical protein